MENGRLLKAIARGMNWFPFGLYFYTEKLKTGEPGPKVSVTFSKKKFTVKMPLDKLEKGHFNWDYEAGALIIRGAKHSKNNNALTPEHGPFLHKIRLPENLDFGNRRAILGATVFELTIPVNKNRIVEKIKTVYYNRAA